MEPPGLLEEMSGGGSGMERGLTAANRTLSCGRPASEERPTCGNAGRQKDKSYPLLVEQSSRSRRRRFLTVEVEQVLVVTDLGHIPRGHGIRRENRATQVRGPEVVRTQRLLLGVAVWREGSGLF